MKFGKNIVTVFELPPEAPPAVAEAKQKFDELATRWAALGDNLGDAEAEVEPAKVKDAEAIATAFEKNGSPPKDLSKHERDALAKVAGLRRVLKAAETSVDEAGNAMLGPIEAARTSWIGTLRPVVDEKHDRYQTAIAEARKALAELQTAKAAVNWLENFEVNEARAYRRTRSFLVKGPRALVEDHIGTQHDAAVLLELAARVGEPTGAERRAARHAGAA